jgi:hypothetical protein
MTPRAQHPRTSRARHQPPSQIRLDPYWIITYDEHDASGINRRTPSYSAKSSNEGVLTRTRHPHAALSPTTSQPTPRPPASPPSTSLTAPPVSNNNVAQHRVSIFYTKLHRRLLSPLLETDQPPAPPEIRHALVTIDHTIRDYITHARLGTAA